MAEQSKATNKKPTQNDALTRRKEKKQKMDKSKVKKENHCIFQQKQPG